MAAIRLWGVGGGIPLLSKQRHQTLICQEMAILQTERREGDGGILLPNQQISDLALHSLRSVC